MSKRKYVAAITTGLFVIWIGWTLHFYLTTFPITIIYTNDLHGNILPDKEKGGAATISAFLKRQKGDYLLLDAGDFFQGTPESDLSSGKNTVIVMNHLKYDAATLGNHEFDFGIQTLKQLSKLANFPFLSANIKYKGKTPDFARSYIIKEIKETKIGVFGLTSDRTPQMSIPENVEGVDFENPIESAKKVISEMKNKDVNLIIALTHLGFEKENQDYTGDRALAQNIDGIDVIIGGHTHTKVDGVKINKTYIVQTAGLGKTVGKLTLRLEKKTKKIRCVKNKIIEMDVKKIGEDEETKKIVSEMTKKISERLSEKIGKCETDLLRKRDAESNIGNFLADTMRAFAKTDIAFHNSGGIRTDLKKGDITLRDVYTLNPFDNTVVTMKLSGSQIKEIIQDSFSGTYGILQVSGIKIIYDKNSKETEVFFNNQPIKEQKKYTVATNSFLAAGGDGFTTFTKGEDIKNTGKKFRDVIIEYIKSSKTISAKIDGRILIK